MNPKAHLQIIIINVLYILVLGLNCLNLIDGLSFFDGRIVVTFLYCFTTLHFLTVTVFIYKFITSRKRILFFILSSILVVTIGQILEILRMFELFKLNQIWDNSSPNMIFSGTLLYAIIILLIKRKNFILIKIYALSIITVFIIIAISVIVYHNRLNGITMLFLSIPPVIFLSELIKNQKKMLKTAEQTN